MRIIVAMSIAAVMMTPIANFGIADSASTTGKPQIGTINGHPVFGEKPQRSAESFTANHGKPPVSDADQQEVAAIAAQQNCNIVRGGIVGAAEANQKSSLGVTVSQDEIAQASKLYWQMHDPNEELQKRQSQFGTSYAAATAVYDKGQDPETVYQQIIKPYYDQRSFGSGFTASVA